MKNLLKLKLAQWWISMLPIMFTHIFLAGTAKIFDLALRS